jgi:hypothetical protein
MSTDDGSAIDESDGHSSKADASIHERRESASNSTVERPVQPPKHSADSICTGEGMQIVDSDEQPEKADFRIHASFESEAKSTCRRSLQRQKQPSLSRSTGAGMQIIARDEQSQKHSSPRVLTDEGMQIDESDEHPQKAPFSIDTSCAGESNETSRRVVQRAKHRSPIVCRAAGR